MAKKRSTQEVQDILQEAKDRFRRVESREASFRGRFRDDVRFAEADAYNMNQWPADIQTSRQKRPMLTINRVRQHLLDILNDARQSRVSVKVRPLRGGANYKAAEMLDGVIRHIEYISNANSAYQAALKFAVQGGIGWIRLATDYVGDDTFDQDIFIRGYYTSDDVMKVYLDPDIKEFDGSDAKWGFVFTDMPQDDFNKNKKYKKYRDVARNNDLKPGDTWGDVEGNVRIAEYFRCVQQEEKLYAFVDPNTQERVIKREKDIDAEMLSVVVDDPQTAERSIVLTRVEHFEIVGDHLAEENEWPGRYIPLIRCVGEETVMDGQLDRKGHTRCMLDQQRMLNYNASGAVEYGALQNKSPYIGPAMAIEENQSVWENANTENYAILTYKHIDDEGNPIPKPERQAPPMQSVLFQQGMRDAVEQLYLASGQNPSDFGQPGNEKSGVAITARQRQGDNATYHYLDHQATMVRLCGKQLVDLITSGKVYDTKRVVKHRDDAGNESELVIDPEAEEAYVEQKDPQTGKTVAILNPTMGFYDVEADVGPAYATRRQEAFNAFSQLLSQNQELVSIVGDIWMRFADIPGAQEAAERLKRMIPQQALADGPSPDLVQAQQQIQALEGLITELAAKLESKAGEGKNAEEKNAIAGYKAVTDRVKALEKALALDPGGLMVLVKEVIEEAQAQSAGGNALEHAMNDDPAQADIHQDLGGQLPPAQAPMAGGPTPSATEAPLPA
jgi:hypothetical protein